MLATEREYAPAERFWEKRMGATRFKNTDELIAVSPARQADKARAPILLMHGKDDTIVPLFQSSRMRDALKAAGKAHVYVELKGEDHWLSRSTSRTEMLERSIAFIDEHIGAK
jgi:dipeptidyl aminopeptidase/acylaminoacyl peptidase